MDMPTTRAASQDSVSSGSDQAFPVGEKPLWQTPKIVSLDIEDTLAGGPGVTDAGILS